MSGRLWSSFLSICIEKSQSNLKFSLSSTFFLPLVTPFRSNGRKRERARARETREGWGSACPEGRRKSFPAPNLISWQPSPLACLLLVRPFFLVPTTSKRLVRRLPPFQIHVVWPNVRPKRVSVYIFSVPTLHGHSDKRWLIRAVYIKRGKITLVSYKKCPK